MDERSRQVERRWRASGAPEDEAAYRRERYRAEGPSPDAAAAERMLGDPAPVPALHARFLRELARSTEGHQLQLVRAIRRGGRPEDVPAPWLPGWVGTEPRVEPVERDLLLWAHGLSCDGCDESESAGRWPFAPAVALIGVARGLQIAPDVEGVHLRVAALLHRWLVDGEDAVATEAAHLVNGRAAVLARAGPASRSANAVRCAVDIASALMRRRRRGLLPRARLPFEHLAWDLLLAADVGPLRAACAAELVEVVRTHPRPWWLAREV